MSNEDIAQVLLIIASVIIFGIIGIGILTC